MASIEQKLKEIVAEQLGVKEEDINFASTFEELGADSLDTVEIAMEVEEEYDIELSDDVLSEITTFGELHEKVVELT